MLQLLYTVIFSEMLLILTLIFKTPLRKFVINFLDRGRVPIVLSTVCATLVVVLTSSLYSMVKIQPHIFEAHILNPTHQVLMSKHMLEASLMGILLVLYMMIDRLHLYIRNLPLLKKTVEDIRKLKEEIATLTTLLTTLTEEIATLNSKKEKLKSAIEAKRNEIKKQSEALEKQSEALEKQSEALQKQSEAFKKQLETLKKKSETLKKLIKISL